MFHQNVYVVADSNHGYKMIGVGALVAKELLGEPQPLWRPSVTRGSRRAGYIP
ncbi:MAG: hypothetical protein H0W82_05355 [Actinobacteria bacterium]|nr:hypothetical protein [Actinomycetota bacterium]